MKRKHRIQMAALCVLMLAMPGFAGCGKEAGPVTQADSYYEGSKMDEEELGDGFTSRMDEIYNDAMERFTDPDTQVEAMEGDDIADKLLRKFLSGYHRSYRVFRTLSPVICACSIAIGIFMMVLAKHNKRVKRTGLTLFIIGIPAAVLILVFGIGIFNGMILY